MQNKLKFYRQQKNITQLELAKKVSVDVRTYQHYETGSRKPDIYIAQNLAKVLDVDINELFPPCGNK